MHLIIGHTAHDSTWIWVRGDQRHRRFKLVLETVPEAKGSQPVCVADRKLEVDAKRDYTAVECFDSLKPNTSYKVVLSSLTSDRKPVEGQLRTFPEPAEALPFHFLHGSCNLPTARLTALGSMAAGLLGSAATSKALELPFAEWDFDRLTGCKRPLGWRGIRWVVRSLVRLMNKAVRGYAFLTRWEQPEPLLPSPFEQLLASTVDEKDPYAHPAFMIHCGDQIYYDLDFPPRKGKQKDYRRNYRQAWFNDEYAARFLKSFPQYMMLDDHEVVDGFGTDREPNETDERLRKPALRAFDEYVSSRHPHSDGLYYTFQHGNTGFFVLDTRTERSAPKRQMVSENQLRALENWLKKKSFGLRFVVSSVPFVAELRPPGLDRTGERRGDGRADKWSGAAWKSQRERIISAIYEGEVDRLVFLVGDMHCTYHARMLIGEPRRRVTVHELAGGPLNQLDFAKRDDFYSRCTGTFPRASKKSSGDASPEEASLEDALPESEELRLPWTSTIEAFHGAAPSVLKISVTWESTSAPLQVRWTALRTHSAPVEREPHRSLSKPVDPHDLCGRIRFHRKPSEDR